MNIDRNFKLGVAGLVLIAVALIGGLICNNSDVEATERVEIPCPPGYADCSGVPLPDPTATAEPTATPYPTSVPTATPSPLSCRHTHDGETEYVHFGMNHADVRVAIGVFETYDPERCRH